MSREDVYAIDPSGCPAALSFPQAPYLCVQCTLAPGHDGLHSASTRVRVGGQPPSRDYTVPEVHERVFLSWTTTAKETV